MPGEAIAPDPNMPIPDRGYGYRYGSQQMPDTDQWAGKLPPNDQPIKGDGYYGYLPRSDGSPNKSSEISIGIELGDKRYHVPSMVPGLSKDQLNYLLQTPEDQLYKRDKHTMQAIQDNASKWAQQRIAAGLPVFATAPEEGKYQPNPGTLRQAIEQSIARKP
ncbi:hypothetical protein UFOVP4_8 [uncultured Caudovirales phage]|uniref:Uncharacterized protein n=1 Tax=uncultured Caudovirales phage TaxID=2100421 RepID=A0A6J5KG48_9CAUD|nr:hypothetical protein UFOVP4_8 [uncultured Caudovirales phage]CAB4241345.1 hypothetical protein UFOVP64_51 [uncultured Caudovirales phage]CAB5078966.1 hypothetical protein UFOVP145_7 [uncultured Caudovirales phage]